MENCQNPKTRLPSSERILKAASAGDLAFFVNQFKFDGFGDLIRTEIHTKSGDTVLHLASRNDHVPLVEYLIQEGLNPETGNFDGKTALHEAAQYESVSSVKHLLSIKCRVNSLKRADWTPLMLACTKRNREVVKLLLEAGTDTTLKNKDGWNSFHIAVREGYIPIIRKLHIWNAGLWDTVSKNGRTPLHTAALHGHVDVVQYLLDNCCYDTDMKDSCGSTPLMDAIRAGHVQVAQILAVRALHGHVDVVQYLLDNCCYDTDLKDSCGSTPLMDAIRAGHVQVADLLIKHHRADVSLVDNLGRSAVHLAAQTGATESISYLVQDWGVRPDLQCVGNDVTALHIAAKEGHLSSIQLLLSLGVDINTTDNKGRSALHIACGAQHLDCVRVLLESAADVKPDSSGTLPQQLARKPDIVKLFQEMDIT